MLMKIRDGATGIVAYIIVILLAIPFALWGIHEYFGGPADQIVADINGQEISKRLFDTQLQDQRRYLKSILGDSFDSVYSDENVLKQSVLDSIIQNALVSDESKTAGYRISNEQLFERIRSVPQFQKEGKFDTDTYQKLLAAQRRSAVEFEEQLRTEESIKQFQTSVLFSSFLPKKSKQQYAALKQQKRNFDYLLLAADTESVDISEQEINDYYQSNQQSFKTPEKVILQYLEILQKDIGAKLDYSDEEILAAYNDDPDRYRTQELRKANHMLFKLSEESTAEEMTVAFDKAKASIERINNGESFADVAKEVSDDKFSAKNGGALGFLSRSDINNPPFVDKLFSMSVGEVSEPVRTNLGVQVVQLEDITPSKRKSFEEVKGQIESELRSEAAQKEFVEQAEQLSNLSYVNEDNLESAAEALDMELQTSEWITGSSLEGIASFPGVVAAAFSEEVLKNGENSTLLELDDGHVAVVRVLEHQEEQVQSLEEVSDSIRQLVKLSKAHKKLIEKGESVLTELQSNSDQLNQQASQLDASVITAGSLLRDDDSVGEELLTKVFEIAIPEDGQPVVEGFVMSDGQYAIVRLNEVFESEDSATSVEVSEWISLQGRYGRREMSSMLKALRETGDVTIFTDQL